MTYDNTVAFLQSEASKAMMEAVNSRARISGLAKPGMREPNFSHTVNAPVIDAPPQFSDLFEGGDSTDPTFRWLNEKSEEWIAKYFPSINGCLKTLPEDWLCGVIGGVRPLGYSGDYFDLVWNQARDRASRAATSEIATINAAFSQRGFTLPPGAYVDAVDRAMQRGTDAALEVNRTEAIKDAEIKLDLLKFAEQLAVTYKTGIMSAMADFYRLWIEIPDKDLERARIRSQAMSAFYSALSSYYGVEVSFEQLRLKAKELDAEVDLAVDRNRVSSYSADSSANSALGQAVNGFASIAAAANNAASTLSAQIEAL